MQSPPPPADETERLASLRALGILDTPPEERFDRITRTTAALLDVPIALVSLVDVNRQWFKSCVGLDDRQTDRSVSFCGHAILQDGVFVVPDALDDLRFADNPLVVGEPHVRFYAGAPLRDASGHALGTLCIIDRRPRQFSAEGRSRLTDLAAWATSELTTTQIQRGFRRYVRAEQIVSHARTGIITVDHHGAIGFANDAAAAILGAAADDLVGQPTHDTLHGTRCPGGACELRRAIGHQHVLEPVDDVFSGADGREVAVEVAAYPLPGDDDIAAVVTFGDITARSEMQRMKDEFLSVVSHELRTPLTSIRGSLGLLSLGAAGEIDDEARSLLEVAVGNTDRLVRLVNDILDLERVTAGRLELLPELHSARALAELALQTVQGMAVSHGVTLSVTGTDAAVEVDGDRIVQAVTNLLSNAVKFSPAGSAAVVDVSTDGSAVAIAVRDAGRGIPADRVAAVFERFEQVDSSDARQLGGTGLGLSITRALVEAHGGTIDVTSTLGVGSTFTIRLPAAGV